MRRINEFLEGQQWSCKGPVRLKYKLTVFHGGRLYTRYQQLPDKRHKIRINTLINDEPICEVDFSANHLRLAMAVLHDEDAGDNPYEDIMAIAGIDDRDLVKSFITTALGAARLRRTGIHRRQKRRKRRKRRMIANHAGRGCGRRCYVRVGSRRSRKRLSLSVSRSLWATWPKNGSG